ncbi:MAG TPA: hypothetical protein VGJ60_11040 [Chloroflexota bacterium]|jgi:hypothetical protein
MHEYEQSQAASADWRQRAERVVDPFQPRPSSTLSASEIGQFAFCPQAWYLARCDIPVDAEASVRLEAGTRAHRRIGRRTDLIRAGDVIRVWLLILMLGLTAFAAALATRGSI